LEYHYAAYFLCTCNWENLKLYGLWLTQTRIKIIIQYLCDSLVNVNHKSMSSFSCSCDDDLSDEGVELLAQVLAHEHSLALLIILGSSQGHTKIICDSH